MTTCLNSIPVPIHKWRWYCCVVSIGTFFCLCASELITTTLAADDRPKIRREVEELIQQLDASTLIERSHAERQLIGMGPEVLPFLPAPDLIESVSAREAVRRIRPQLERRAARESAAASHVTLQGERSLREILEQIQLQTKNRVSLGDATDAIRERRLSVKWDSTLFWECLDEVCQRCDLDWMFAKDDAEIRLTPHRAAEAADLGVQRTGSFRLTVTDAEVRPVIGNDNDRLLRVSGHLSIEPRLRPLFLSMQATNIHATSDTDQLLANWNPDAKYEFPVGDGGRDMPVKWDFLLPIGKDAKSVSVRGRLKCEIAAATERVVFDQKSLTRGTIRRRGGVSVRLRRVTFNSDDPDEPAADIGVVVSYDTGGPAFESHRSWIFHNSAYLETKTAARTDFTDFETTQQADGAIAVDYRFKKLPAPVEQCVFVYEAPTLLISVPVEIDLEGIRIKQ